LPDQLDDVGRQPCLVVSTVRDLALRRAMLTECRAGTALGNRQRSSNMLDAGAAARGAQQFPRDASCNISLSSVRSDTARRSRVFSVSRSFSRFTWSLFNPPNS
jgi:hypothetical protein